MFFPSRIDASHPRVVGHSVYRQHVSRGPGVDRVGVRITAQIVETGDHRFLQPLVNYILAPEIAHSVLHPFKIGNCYAAGVRQNVGNHKNSLLMQDLVRRGGRWAIGALLPALCT